MLWTLPVALLVASLNFDTAVESSNAAVAALRAESGVPAISVAVGHGGAIVHAAAHGFASLQDSLAATVQTRFGIGSITKSLTLALVARLVERGILDWDTPIEVWLEDFPFRGAGMTLRDIGVHQSGINDDFSNALRFTTQRYSTREACREILATPLDFAPGTQSRYATGSFTVIARVLEVVTGDRFEDLMQREILEPAGMADTAVWDPRAGLARVAAFYDPRDAELAAVSVDSSHKLAGAGYVSTASDLVRFGMALLEGRLCDPAALLREHSTDDGANTGYGLGWRATEDEGEIVWFQPGGGPGISCALVLCPRSGLVVAILANATAAPVGGVALERTLRAFQAVAE